jgi:RNA polymerase sigma factor (sigma-70 family)
MAEPENFGVFYRATVVPLRRFLARMVRNPNDAQDLAHDAYRRVYQAMEVRHVEKPQAFLYTTARRLALKMIRRRQISPVREAGDNVIELAPSSAPGVEEIVIARQEWERVQSAIAELPPGCRSVLQLAHRDGLSHAEIGNRLSIAVSTVEKQHARALRLLREMLHEDAPVAAPRTSEGGACAANK